VKLRHLPKWNELRRERAVEYNRLLAENDQIIYPYEPSWSRAVYHLYIVRIQDRDGLMKHLKDAGIGTGIHYPVPLHMQKAYASLGYEPEDLPVCTRVAAEILSLPMYPQLTAQQQERAGREIANFTAQSRAAAELVLAARS